MRISYWSSDVCSSDLLGQSRRRAARVDAVRRIPPGRRPTRTQRARSTRRRRAGGAAGDAARYRVGDDRLPLPRRSEEHTSELQSLMRISYAVFCLKKKINTDADNANDIIQSELHAE